LLPEARGAASNTVWRAGANPAPAIGRFGRVAGSTWEEETNPRQARATKPPPRRGARERPGGRANGRVVTGRNACSVEIRCPREVACGRTWSAPSHLLLAKAAVAREEIDHMHRASTRRRGRDTSGGRHTVKARTVRWTSRAWPKRQRPSSTRPRSEGRGGHRTRAWARSSEEGGQCLRSEGALGSDGRAARRGRHTAAGNPPCKRACRAVEQTRRAPRNAGHRLIRRPPREGSMGKVTSPTGPGKSRRPG
jgi:hypothetical protein